MSEQQWEFCELTLYNVEEVKGKGRKYGLLIIYMDGNPGERVDLATNEGKNSKIWTYNPFLRTIGLLGSFGWELVPFQRSNG